MVGAFFCSELQTAHKIGGGGGGVPGSGNTDCACANNFCAAPLPPCNVVHIHVHICMVKGPHEYMYDVLTVTLYPVLYRVTKKTVRHPSSSSTPSNRLLLSSPAIVFKNTKNDSAITDPAHSSMVAGVLGGLLPDISPITYNETGCATEGEGEDEQPPVRAAERTESGNSDGCLTMGVVETRKVLTRQQLFPPTPIKDVHMEVSVRLCMYMHKYNWYAPS